MKALFFLLAGLAFSGAAQANENYVINLDWGNPMTLNDSVVLQCDDTAYAYAELVIPGKAGRDFDITMDGVDIADGELKSSCGISKKERRGSTVYILDPQDSCDLHVYKKRPDFRDKPQSAHYEIHDAC